MNQTLQLFRKTKFKCPNSSPLQCITIEHSHSPQQPVVNQYSMPKLNKSSARFRSKIIPLKLWQMSIHHGFRIQKYIQQKQHSVPMDPLCFCGFLQSPIEARADHLFVNIGRRNFRIFRCDLSHVTNTVTIHHRTLEPVCCKKQQKKVLDQLLVCGIGDL